MRFTTLKPAKEHIAKKEVSAAHFIPYKCHWNSNTILTYKEELVRVVKIKGFAFETADDVDVDLKKASETVSGTQLVNIKGLQWALGTGTEATVTRDSVVLYTCIGTGHIDFYDWADTHKNDTNIVVAVDNGGTGGTVILSLSKVGGFGSQQHQDADGVLG